MLRYVLRTTDQGLHLPIQSLRSLTLSVAHQRSKNRRLIDLTSTPRLVGKNWLQGLYNRHLDGKARKLKAIDSNRVDGQLEGKIRDWFSVIAKQLDNPSIVPKNVYNMDETRLLLSVLNSHRALVGSHDSRKHRAVSVNQSLVTAVKCILADGRRLGLLTICPATTHRS